MALVVGGAAPLGQLAHVVVEEARQIGRIVGERLTQRIVRAELATQRQRQIRSQSGEAHAVLDALLDLAFCSWMTCGEASLDGLAKKARERERGE